MKIVQYKSGIANAYLIQTKTGWIAFDTGSVIDKDAFLKVLEENSIKPEEIKLIVISHEHDDHFVNAATMREITGAPIVCHKKVTDTLVTGRRAELYPRNKYGKWIVENLFKGDIEMPELPKFKPDMTFEKEFSLYAYGLDGKLIETPGHTPGSISLITDDRIAFVGDTVVAQSPLIERPCCVAYFCFTEKTEIANRLIIPSCETLLERADTFYSGHGGPFSREEVLEALKEAKEEIEK